MQRLRRLGRTHLPQLSPRVSTCPVAQGPRRRACCPPHLSIRLGEGKGALGCPPPLTLAPASAFVQTAPHCNDSHSRSHSGLEPCTARRPRRLGFSPGNKAGGVSPRKGPFGAHSLGTSVFTAMGFRAAGKPCRDLSLVLRWLWLRALSPSVLVVIPPDGCRSDPVL